MQVIYNTYLAGGRRCCTHEALSIESVEQYVKKDTRLSSLFCTANDSKLGGVWEQGYRGQCWSVSLVAQLHVQRLFGRAKLEMVSQDHFLVNCMFTHFHTIIALINTINIYA